MISYLKIKNFRSIIKAETNFKELTVLVGANGSGKSNVIKSLQFLSSIPQNGLEGTVISFGGYHTLLPKALSRDTINKSTIEFKYSMNIDEPPNFPKYISPLKVDHHFILSSDKKNDAKLDYEEINFDKALNIAAITLELSKKPDKDFNNLTIKETFSDSYIKIIRKYGLNDAFLSSENINKDNVDLFLEWLGIKFLFEEKDSPLNFENVKNTIVSLCKRRSRQKKEDLNPLESLIENSNPSACTFSPEARRFSELVSRIKRYDIQQNELRREQQISALGSLTFEGKNMPSALRHLKKKNDKAFNRIISTLGELNPFIETADVNSLKTGKEFVFFIENKLKQHVESWETSDGTLRGLALLLALETHPPYGTIIIEEPEQNLHPWAIRSLMNHIRKVIDERKIQVILTTHSQQVLECMYPDEVRVVTRSKNKGTKLQTLNDLLPNNQIEMGDVGRLWVKGLLNGVPSYES